MSEFKNEYDAWNRSFYMSAYISKLDISPVLRNPVEKFEAQAENAARELIGNEEQELLDKFMVNIISKTKHLTLNGGALALVYFECFKGDKLNMKLSKKLLDNLSGIKPQHAKFIEEYGITPQDLVRYIRLCATL
jgi:hypothetical protein